MTPLKAAYDELRDALLRTGGLLGAVLLLMLAAGGYNAHAERARLAAEQAFQDTLGEYRNAIASEQTLRSAAERFDALREQGFIGAEPRLRWIEDVRAAAAQARLVSIRYDLEPRRVEPSADATGSYQLFASDMKLRLALGHEGDLLAFLQALEARRGGLFELNACALQRDRGDAGISLREANLKAECMLRWYSLDVPEGAQSADFDGGYS